MTKKDKNSGPKQPQGPVEIDIKTIDMELLEKLVSEDPGIIPYGHHKGSAVIRPDDIGIAKYKALQAMGEQTESQLSQIYEQMRLLASQAKKLQDRIEVSKKVYLAKYSFVPVIGEIYHLYEGDTPGEYSLSLLSPQDWGEKSKKKFVASVKLLADHTWKII